MLLSSAQPATRRSPDPFQTRLSILFSVFCFCFAARMRYSCIVSHSHIASHLRYGLRRARIRSDQSFPYIGIKRRMKCRDHLSSGQVGQWVMSRDGLSCPPRHIGQRDWLEGIDQKGNDESVCVVVYRVETDERVFPRLNVIILVFTVWYGNALNINVKMQI